MTTEKTLTLVQSTDLIQISLLWHSLICVPFYGSIHFCYTCAAAAAKLLQSCPTLCDPIDGSPPGSSVPGILQARTLEWVAISFSSAWKWKWSRSVVSNYLQPHGLQHTRLLHPWEFPGKSTAVGCHCFLRVTCVLSHFSRVWLCATP